MPPAGGAAAGLPGDCQAAVGSLVQSGKELMGQELGLREEAIHRWVGAGAGAGRTAWGGELKWSSSRRSNRRRKRKICLRGCKEKMEVDQEAQEKS